MFCRLLFVAGIALSLLFLAIFAAPGSAAEASDTRTPTSTRPADSTRQQAWQAVSAELRAQGWPAPQLPRIDDLDLPAALPRLAGDRLRVASVCWEERAQRTQFRLECGEPRHCLPFLVYLPTDTRTDFRTDLPTDLRNAPRHAAPCRPTLQPRAAVKSPAAAAAVSSKATVRAGEPATAVFLSANFRMTANVICLDRGSEGEIIRVRSQNGQVFRARISGPARLEAVP